MIGGVESLEPKLQVPALGEVEILQRREIPSDDSGAGEHIAADVAERAQGLQGEGLDVEPRIRRGVGELGADAGGVRTVVADGGVGPVQTVLDVLREPCRNGHNRTESPAANDAAGDASVEILAAFAYGQIVEH